MQRLIVVTPAAPEEREKLKMTICAAHESGFSPIEIARIMGSKNADFSYTVLRHAKLIKPLPRGKPPKVDIDPKLANVFQKKGYSFQKWCNYWGFGREEALFALDEVPDVKGRVMDIHIAFRRDFPDAYEAIYPDSCVNNFDVVRRQNRLVKSMAQIKVEIVWDEPESRFVAMAGTTPMIYGYGDNWVNAIKDLQEVWLLEKSIIRLRDVLDQHQKIALP